MNQLQLANFKNLKIPGKTTKSLLFGLIGGIAISSFSSFAADYSRVEKELRIMTKIFEASTSEEKGNSHRTLFPSGFGKMESTYLAKQGMVFSFKFNNSRFGDAGDWQVFGEGIGHLVGSISREIGHAFADIDAPNPPTAPESPSADIGEWSDAWEDNMEAYGNYREAMDLLSDENREHREEIRSLQREIRDIERQARRADSDELKNNKIKLENKVAKLSEKMKMYEKSMQEYREKRQEKYRANNKKKSDAILATLCDYGATLRSLKNGEHITLVFENYENNKDQIHVFDYSDVRDCSSKEKLLKEAISYQL